MEGGQAEAGTDLLFLGSGITADSTALWKQRTLARPKEENRSVSCSVVSDSLWLHGLWPARLLCPWNLPGKNTEVGFHFLLQGSWTQGSNQGLLHCRKILYHLSHQERPHKGCYDKPRQSIKKQRHHFADKGPCSQSMVFPVVLYRCESWIIKKAEWQRIDAFEFWCWRRLLRVPWTAKRSNQFILKEINPEYSLEGPKLHDLGHLMPAHWIKPWCWERLRAGGKGDDRG